MTPDAKRSLHTFWHATVRGCAIAIAVLFLFLAIMSISSASAERDEHGLTFSSFLTLTGFSLLISYAKEIFRIKALIAPAQWLLNFLVVGIGFFFVILKSGMNATTNGSFYITGVLLYVLVYLAVFGITMLIKLFTTKKEPNGEPEEYVSRFGNV